MNFLFKSITNTEIIMKSYNRLLTDCAEELNLIGNIDNPVKKLEYDRMLRDLALAYWYELDSVDQQELIEDGLMDEVNDLIFGLEDDDDKLWHTEKFLDSLKELAYAKYAYFIETELETELRSIQDQEKFGSEMDEWLYYDNKDRIHDMKLALWR